MHSRHSFDGKYLMSSFDLKKYISHLPSQNNIPCCAASSSLKAAEIIMASAGNTIRFSRLFTFYMARKMANKLTQDGLSIKETLDSMMYYGVATDDTWPFYIDRVNKEPNDKSKDEALNCKLDSYEYLSPENFNNFLRQEIPIIVGIQTGRMYWKLKGTFDKQFYKPINTTDNLKHRDHAVTIIGYDDTILGGSWIVANSHGLLWGDHGLGIFPYECAQDIGESYAITEFAGISPGKKISEN